MQELRTEEITADSSALSSRQKIFRKYLEDWTPAYESLIEKELLTREENTYSLTSLGKVFARQLRRDHPPIWYWYKEYYERAPISKAEAEFQGRMNDAMDIFISRIIELGAFTPHSRLLHIGCGDGAIAETISEQTGAHVTGIDFIPEAIRLARERSAGKKDRLTFIEGNASHIHFPTNSFDALLSLGAPLFCVDDLPETIRQMAQVTRPGGTMFILFDDELRSDGTTEIPSMVTHQTLAEILQSRGLPLTTHDFTNTRLSRAKQELQLAGELKCSYETEGNLSLYERHANNARTLIKKIESSQMRSCLYHIQLP